MSLILAASPVTIPAVSYSQHFEDRTARLTISTPVSEDPANPLKRFTIEVSREKTEFRDGVRHSSVFRDFRPSIEQVMAHPDGPATMSAIVTILDDLVRSAGVP